MSAPSFDLACRSAVRGFVSVPFGPLRGPRGGLEMARITEILSSPYRELVPNEVLLANYRYADPRELNSDAARPRRIELDARN